MIALMAVGSAFFGFLASAAAKAAISLPRVEKEAWLVAAL
jgi:hypothetical protein